mmetsp:Transcript_32405/g.64328  ORF Transcript_32405/g.64328 Transcript_32405/m.64328 type:complete len:158 (-) Transcript_32405:478-951(-)
MTEGTFEALRWKDGAIGIARQQLRDLGPHEVRIRVAFAGVCGTDLHALSGEFPLPDEVTLGHEFVGVIEAVGRHAEHFREGQRVVVNPNEGCFRCLECQRGRPHFCPNASLSKNIGLVRDGGLSEVAVVPDTTVHLLPDSLPLREAVLIEPLACVVS